MRQQQDTKSQTDSTPKICNISSQINYKLTYYTENTINTERICTMFCFEMKVGCF